MSYQYYYIDLLASFLQVMGGWARACALEIASFEKAQFSHGLVRRVTSF